MGEGLHIPYFAVKIHKYVGMHRRNGSRRIRTAPLAWLYGGVNPLPLKKFAGDPSHFRVKIGIGVKDRTAGILPLDFLFIFQQWGVAIVIEKLIIIQQRALELIKSMHQVVSVRNGID